MSAAGGTLSANSMRTFCPLREIDGDIFICADIFYGEDGIGLIPLILKEGSRDVAL